MLNGLAAQIVSLYPILELVNRLGEGTKVITYCFHFTVCSKKLLHLTVELYEIGKLIPTLVSFYGNNDF